ncbi:3-deoxy-D-manno-octulosonic acid transferase [Puniceibacterium sp. IMCC21224]|uniref:3-deoxy-D-manno-octulosonic acid transferase n=1 Tax=Puniceibacterium sp. IMCC21224 TaxID=1618204 RepID=UPI00064DF2A5|nr:glycosyltransferase N-terminal domain-containing protein [Puniceibacterium sp. IMCC21224]
MLLYRLLNSIYVLWQMLRLLWRRDFTSLIARFGGGPIVVGPHLWLHGASNGELASARPILTKLSQQRPYLGLLVTTNTRTGLDLARSWNIPRLDARLAPFDLGWLVRRLHRRWQVQSHIVMESDLWPHRILSCPGPVVVLGGRMTRGSARGWGWFGPLGARALGRVKYLSAQDGGSRDRFLALGLAQSACGPTVDLKALYTPPPDQRPDATLRDAYPRELTWFAASTHPGEETIVIAAHLLAREARPGLRLILAPRHPDRAAEVAQLLQHAGLPYATRTGGGQAEVLLADTMGEMALWYALAGAVFIGGTLTDRGGHTPYEPATFGAALIHGDDVRNFAKSFAQLIKAQASEQVHDAATLAQALVRLGDVETQVARGQAAQTALQQDTDLNGLMRDVLLIVAPPSDVP